MSAFILVDEPLIEYVLDQAIGQESKAREYVFESERDVAKIRLRVFDAIKRNEPNIICAACHTPVYPRKNCKTGKFHFAHVSENDENICPYNERRGRLDTTRIDAMRYNGQKEGPDHKRIKHLLRVSIDADSLFDHDKTREEKNWYGSTDEKKWRRPDIAATRILENDSQQIAFEIQLSSTYLKVIAERRLFYLQDSALLFWIFKDANLIDSRQYQDDLFYNNNSNLFVVDEETAHLSKEQGKLIFRCCYYEPVLEGATIKDSPRERFVCFDELTIDIEQQRVYWFNYENEKEKLIKEGLRRRYENLWINAHRDDQDNAENEYNSIKQEFSLYHIIIPDYQKKYLIKDFTQVVFSAKYGKPFLANFRSLLEIANFFYQTRSRRRFLFYFGRVLEYYKTWDKLLVQDECAAKKKKSTGKQHISWKEKGTIIGKKIKENDPEFIQDRSFDNLFLFLFPNITLSDSKNCQTKPNQL